MSDAFQRQVSVGYSLAVGTLLSFVTVIGLAANVLVVIAILGDKKLRKSPMNMLLLNLVRTVNDDDRDFSLVVDEI